MPFAALVRACRIALIGLLLPLGAAAGAAPVLTLAVAQAVASDAERFPLEVPAVRVALPDDWSETRPGYGGAVWYRFVFDAEPEPGDALQAVYIAHVCSNFELQLNGYRIAGDGRLSEPVTRHCYQPQLVSLPAALLKAQGNRLDLKVVGYPLERVAARQRAGGVSALKVGPQEVLAGEHAWRRFWNLTVPQVVGLTLLVLGAFMFALGWINRRESYLLYFGGLSMGWAVLSARLWVTQMPVDNATTEFLIASAFPPVATCAVLFLLRYARLRPRWVDTALLLQCLLVPASLALAGPQHLFALATAWFTLQTLELMAAIGTYLWVSWRTQRREFWLMGAVMAIAAALLLFEQAIQHGLLDVPPMHLLHLALPLLFVVVSFRLLQLFVRALRVAEAGKITLESRVREVTAEIERNFAQLAELRVEQVTEKERKRIAADLHDDLGAKLLTIVHTSESERISTLAREALEEMRLSVRGLTGKAVRVDDALADWRAETVSRLGQARIEADWRGPPGELPQHLAARAYVQTTRILREAVSNIIKHSGASHCKVRCSIGERDFMLVIQDNGRGIPLELDGKLDRGHGMSSMKHRAKQLQGQCLVESGPGYGTVIRLTLPL